MENIIKINNISKSFNGHKVLDNINIEVKKGSICGLVGLNGSGKTLVMKVICGLIIPDHGTVIVKGKRIGQDVDFPDNVGIIIENPGFMMYMSAMSNLINLASIRGKVNHEQLKECMRIVGLDYTDKKWVSKYSMGMRQRLAIAQAIMENQDLLILDEPMNGLDKKGVIDMRKLLLQLKAQGKTIVMSSHNQIDIDELCDDIYELDNGSIIYSSH